MKKEYKVPLSQDEWVTPEETLMDSGSNYPDLEQPIADSSFRGFLIIFSVLTFVLMASVFNIGILKHEYFSKLAIQNKSVYFLIPPPRGLIYDYTGRPLVKNVPGFDLLIVSREFQIQGVESQLNKAAGILNLNPDEFVKSLSEKIKSDAVFFAANNLNKDQVLALEYLNIKGAYVVPYVKRSYPGGPVYSQILGYVGRVSKDDLSADNYYSPADYVGKLGVESAYEDYLRGEHGRIFFDKDKTLAAENNFAQGVSGQNVVLNINAKLQEELYQELHNVLTGAGLSRGAAIIQNPNTGQILALVSFPAFDNNLFVNGLSEDAYKKIFENPAKPLFNRVISGLYNPGSTIKPLMGLMALEEGIMRPQDTIQDCVSLSIGDRTFDNWRPDYGPFNLRRAIANSCNIYFFTVGGGFGKITGLGIERIAKYLQAALANVSLDVDIPGEAKGFVPTADWKQRTKNEPWYQGDTYNTSIGQGNLLVTPLWLNSYISAIANGGTLYKPELVNRIVDGRNNAVEIKNPTAIKKLPFKDNVLAEVKSDMEETVLSGTAQMLKDLPVRAGAKTGTAEVLKGRSINSLFTAFAPVDKPEIAITVLVEGSVSNQGLAIRTAHEVLKWYFNSFSIAP